MEGRSDREGEGNVKWKVEAKDWLPSIDQEEDHGAGWVLLY